MHQPKYQRAFLDGAVPHYDTLSIPFRWKKPRTVFVNSMSDLFHVSVPFTFIDQVFAVMSQLPQHTFLILTKRPERMAEYLDGIAQGTKETVDRLLRRDQEPRHFHYPAFHATVLNYRNGKPLPNVWLGTSVEDQITADTRIPHLLRTPAAVRFLSCEPLLAAVDLKKNLGGTQWMGGQRGCGQLDPSGKHYHDDRCQPGIDWVIAGGESGHHARPMHPDWARSLRDQCNAAQVPFFFKQWGEWHTDSKLMSTGESVFREFRSFEQWVNKASTWVNGGICIDKNGKQLRNGKDFMEARDTDTFPVTIMDKVGKHASGNLLDGAVHNAFPR
jgi:protein gp37